MSTKFRINALTVTPHRHSSHRRDFHGGLNIVTGDPGSGKSTLFELVKFALGCEPQKTPVFDQDVRVVSVEVTAESHDLRLTRTVQEGHDHVDVFDLVTQEPVGAFPVSSQGPEPSIGTRLLEWLGIPSDITVLTSGKPKLLTFAHVWEFMHVTQPEIDRSIARSDSASLSNQRRGTFELLFGLTNSELSELSEQIAAAKRKEREARSQHSVVTAFLDGTTIPSQRQLKEDQTTALRRRDRLSAELSSLRSQSGVRDDRMIVLRDLLSISRENDRDVGEAIERLRRVQENRRKRVDYLERELTRVGRMRDANNLLADIEFTVCPRCMQSISERPLLEEECRLCLQPTPRRVPRQRSRRSRERQDEPLPLAVPGDAGVQEEQLAAQREEIADLLTRGQRELEVLEIRKREIGQEAAALSSEIDDLASSSVAPRVDELTTTAEALNRAEADLRQIEEALLLWDGLGDFAASVTELNRQSDELSERRQGIETRLRATREGLFSDLDSIYDDYLRQFHAPNVDVGGTIDRTTYLPLIDGKRFDRISIGGGTRTAFIVAYWLTLVSAALRDPNLLLPGCLILDTPQKSLSPSEDLSKRMYSVLGTLTDGQEERLQIFVIDTEVPRGFQPSREPTKITYAEPAIGSIPHPGPRTGPGVEEMPLPESDEF